MFYIQKTTFCKEKHVQKLTFSEKTEHPQKATQPKTATRNFQWYIIFVSKINSRFAPQNFRPSATRRTQQTWTAEPAPFGPRALQLTTRHVMRGDAKCDNNHRGGAQSHVGAAIFIVYRWGTRGFPLRLHVAWTFTDDTVVWVRRTLRVFDVGR